MSNAKVRYRRWRRARVGSTRARGERIQRWFDFCCDHAEARLLTWGVVSEYDWFLPLDHPPVRPKPRGELTVTSVEPNAGMLEVKGSE
jgi:hypothetical protein